MPGVFHGVRQRSGQYTRNRTLGLAPWNDKPGDDGPSARHLLVEPARRAECLNLEFSLQVWRLLDAGHGASSAARETRTLFEVVRARRRHRRPGPAAA